MNSNQNDPKKSFVFDVLLATTDYYYSTRRSCAWASHNPRQNNGAGSGLMRLFWSDCAFVGCCCSLLKRSSSHLFHLPLSNPVEGQWKYPRRPLSFTASNAPTASRTSQRATYLATLPQLRSPCVSNPSRHKNKTAVCRNEPTRLLLQKSLSANCQQWHHCTAERGEQHRGSPSAVTGPIKQRDSAKMKPRHQTRQQGGKVKERQEWEQGGGRRGRNANCGAVKEVTKKTITSGIWVNNSGLAVKLSLSKCKCC